MFRRFSLGCALALAACAALGPGAGVASAHPVLTLADFGTLLPDRDRIALRIDMLPRGREGEVVIVLRTAPAVTWWKELKVVDRHGRRLNSVWTQDDAHGPV